MRRCIVLDGNSIMFRAYYATCYGEIMHTSTGIYTNAIYGFANMIKHITDTMEFDNIFVAFDKGKKTKRHQEFADYKGGRTKTPEELIMQIPLVKEYLDALKIKHLELDDYEADDIVGSFANKVKDEFDEVLVISGDRDLLQLAKGNIHVCLTKKGVTDMVIHTEENFKELMGIESKQMTDYKGLIGDNSDNLPGIEKVGPVRACQMLEKYGTLENILSHTDDFSGKTKEYIIRDSEQALRTKHLATLYLDVDLPYDVNNTVYEKPNKSELINFYNKVEFKSFAAKVLSDVTEDDYVETVQVEEVKLDNMFINEVDKFITILDSSKEIYVELELAGDNYHNDLVLGLGIIVNNDGYFFDVEHFNDIKNVINNYIGYVLCVDIKKTIVALNRYGLKFKNYCYDFTLAAYVINPSYTSDDLKNVIKFFKENNLPFIENIYSKKTKYVIPDVKVYGEYCLNKINTCKNIMELLDQNIMDNNLSKLLFDVEIPLAEVLADMEITGFKISTKRLNELKIELEDKLVALESEIYKAAGMTFNIASPKQLGEVLFEKLGLPSSKKNKNGYSTAAEVLEKLAKVHSVPRLVLEYRKFAKLYNTYIIGLLEIKKDDDKLHTIFKQALTLTGRLSSVEPNIQNIPIRTEDGRLIRSAFVPSFKDGLLISADYSQIELRILAHMSGCKKMIELFNNGYDLHAGTASLIFDKKMEDITKDERRMAKAVNFGIVYGMSAFGLSEELEIHPADAQKFINKYFEQFPEIKTFLDKVVEDAKEKGYTTTLFNRRRYIPEIKSSNYMLRQFGERTAKNAPIQGTAADVIKLAMIKVNKEFTRLNLRSKLIAQVHDELVCDCPIDEKDIVIKVLKETMENVVKLDVLLNAEVAMGTNWDMK